MLDFKLDFKQKFKLLIILISLGHLLGCLPGRLPGILPGILPINKIIDKHQKVPVEFRPNQQIVESLNKNLPDNPEIDLEKDQVAQTLITNSELFPDRKPLKTIILPSVPSSSQVDSAPTPTIPSTTPTPVVNSIPAEEDDEVAIEKKATSATSESDLVPEQRLSGLEQRSEVTASDSSSETTIVASSSSEDSAYSSYSSTSASANVDLRPYDTTIKSQGNKGLCTSFSVISAIENKLGQNTNTSVDLSEAHLWQLYRVYNIENALKQGATQNFIVEEDLFPYNRTNARLNDSDYDQLNNRGIAKIKDFRYLETTDDIVSALRRGNPVVLATTVNQYWSFEAQDRYNLKGVIPARYSNSNSAHAVSVVGYHYNPNGKSYLIFKNSWGENWGDGGYGYLEYPKYCETFNCYSYEVKSLEYKNKGIKRKASPPSPSAPPSSLNSSANSSSTNSDRIISAENINVKVYVKRKTLKIKQHVFFLYLDAPKNILKQISRVDYHLDPSFGEEYEHSIIEDRSNYFQSDHYSTYDKNWYTQKTTIYFKNGKKIIKKGSLITW